MSQLPPRSPRTSGEVLHLVASSFSVISIHLRSRQRPRTPQGIPYALCFGKNLHLLLWRRMSWATVCLAHFPRENIEYAADATPPQTTPPWLTCGPLSRDPKDLVAAWYRPRGCAPPLAPSMELAARVRKRSPSYDVPVRSGRVGQTSSQTTLRGRQLTPLSCAPAPALAFVLRAPLLSPTPL